MFCNDCGAQFSGNYCRVCGVSSPKDVAKYKAVYETPKFCINCGGEITGTYCVTCGKSSGTLKISATKKLGTPWQRNDNTAPKNISAAGKGNISDASGGSAAASMPPINLQIFQYGLTAIFALALLAVLIPPPFFWGHLSGRGGMELLKILMLVFFSAGIMVPPLVVKDNAQSEHIIYSAAAGICLIFNIIVLAGRSMTVFGFILLLLPIAILAYYGISYWVKLSLPPELKKILDLFHGIRLIWLFCACFLLGSSNLILAVIIIGSISVAAFLLEKDDRSKYKLAIGLLIGGCVIQLLFAIITPYFGLIACLLSLIQIDIAVFIGKDVLSDIAKTISASNAATSGNTGTPSPAYQAQPVNQGQQVSQVQPVSQGQQPYNSSAFPVGQLKTNRGLLKYLLLNLITFGIYSIVFYSSASTDINIIASRYDGRKTMHYCLLLFLVGPITFGIAYFVWFHNIFSRIGNELRRRNIIYSFGAGTFWLWGILGSFIIIGPFVCLYKFSAALNKLAQHYNYNG